MIIVEILLIGIYSQVRGELMSNNVLLIAKSTIELKIIPKMANRHGLITGATGTGKTVTVQRMAEAFSNIGTPVFVSDIKGDLSGLSAAGGNNSKIEERVKQLSLDGFAYRGFPVEFWDVFGEHGLPVRTTISEMGPLLLSRLLALNPVQSGVLNLIFRIADDQGLLLMDLKDLKTMLVYVAENASQYTVEYGNISKQSVGAIQRALLVLEDQGGSLFFGEPALDIRDFMKTTTEGRGVINILDCEQLFHSPVLYSTFMLWMLSELFEELPEVGDLEQPKIIFFFDEAHLLFNDAPKALLERIEQVVRLIRSKGVGIYFCTQNPIDIPDAVLGQLGNRVQHALRAFTPKDQKAIRAAANTFRQNPKYNVEKVITELAVGEALVSFLDDNGRPTEVEKSYIVPPGSRVGPISAEEKQEIMRVSSLKEHYAELIDRESAYEILQKKLAAERSDVKSSKSTRLQKKSPRRSDSILEKMTKSAASSLGRQVARELVRGVLGSILRK